MSLREYVVVHTNLPPRPDILFRAEEPSCKPSWLLRSRPTVQSLPKVKWLLREWKISFWYANLVKMRKKQFTINFNEWTFVFFVVWGSYTFQKMSFLPAEFFRRSKMFLQRKIFIRQFSAVFFVWNVSLRKKKCMTTFTSLGKCWNALLWAFLGQKLR